MICAERKWFPAGLPLCLKQGKRLGKISAWSGLTILQKVSDIMRGDEMGGINEFESSYENQWCPGCGNFGILAAVKDALKSPAVNISAG